MSLINWLKFACLAVFAGLVVSLKVLLGKNKKLKKGLETKEAQIKIKVEQQKAKDEVAKDEPERIEEIKEDNGGTRADRLNRVLNNRDS